MFKKRSALTRKRKKLEKELSSVSSNIRSLSKSVGSKSGRRERGRGGSDAPDVGPTGMAPSSDGLFGQSLAESGYDDVAQPQRKSIGKQTGLHDERFVGYLANSFDSMRPLRHERRIQRNKAVVMAVVVLLLLFWLLYRHFVL